MKDEKGSDEKKEDNVDNSEPVKDNEKEADAGKPPEDGDGGSSKGGEKNG